MTLRVSWIDGGREARCPPDPAFPKGIDLDVAAGAAKICSTLLPYPAPRCGYHEVTCADCGLVIAITAAGRPDDPRSVKVACK